MSYTEGIFGTTAWLFLVSEYSHIVTLILTRHYPVLYFQLATQGGGTKFV